MGSASALHPSKKHKMWWCLTISAQYMGCQGFPKKKEESLQRASNPATEHTGDLCDRNTATRMVVSVTKRVL